MNALAGATRRTLDGLPETLAAADVDALVLDEVLWCVGLVPMHPGMPYVHVSNALTFDFSGNTPLCSYLWPHETTTEALARNQEGLRQSHTSRNPIDPLAATTLSRLGWISTGPIPSRRLSTSLSVAV